MNDFIIVDVDDTIFDWGTSKPLPYSLEALNAIQERYNAKIVYVTGRMSDPTDSIRAAGFPVDLVIYRRFGPTWFLPVVIMKQYTLFLMRMLGLRPIAAYDNDPVNIAMYRANGVKAVEVGKGTWENIFHLLQ